MHVIEVHVYVHAEVLEVVEEEAALHLPAALLAVFQREGREMQAFVVQSQLAAEVVGHLREIQHQMAVLHLKVPAAGLEVPETAAQAYLSAQFSHELGEQAFQEGLRILEICLVQQGPYPHFVGGGVQEGIGPEGAPAFQLIADGRYVPAAFRIPPAVNLQHAHRLAGDVGGIGPDGGDKARRGLERGDEGGLSRGETGQPGHSAREVVHKGQVKLVHAHVQGVCAFPAQSAVNEDGLAPVLYRQLLHAHIALPVADVT